MHLKIKTNAIKNEGGNEEGGMCKIHCTVNMMRNVTFDILVKPDLVFWDKKKK
jgi:hypothetical protein